MIAYVVGRASHACAAASIGLLGVSLIVDGYDTPEVVSWARVSFRVAVYLAVAVVCFSLVGGAL